MTRLPLLSARPDGSRPKTLLIGWDAGDALSPLGKRAKVYDNLDQLTAAITTTAQPGDHVVVMSNGAFGGLHDRLLVAMERVAATLHDAAGR